MINVTCSSRNGNKSPGPSPIGMMILIGLETNSLTWWIWSIRIRKFLIRGEDSWILRGGSIGRNRPEMYLVIGILVIVKTKSKGWNLKELLIYKLKLKYSKINYQVSPLNLHKLETESHWKIKIYYKKSKDFKSNKPNSTPYKRNLRMSFYLFKSST